MPRRFDVDIAALWVAPAEGDRIFRPSAQLKRAFACDVYLQRQTTVGQPLNFGACGWKASGLLLHHDRF